MSEIDTPNPENDSSSQTEARNRWLEAVLNPSGELPSITFPGYTEIALPEGSQQATVGQRASAYDADGEYVGYISMTVPVRSAAAVAGARAVIEWIELDESHRGRGYGNAMYLELLKSLPLGVGLRSDTTINKGTFLIWEWMRQAGVAQHEGSPRSLKPDRRGVYRNPNFRTTY
jgi:GNAT superfamily N-acetyltransferase